MAVLEVKRTTEGKVLARRMDGQPLTPEDRQEARWMAAVRELPPRAWVIGEINDPATGELRAVHICSAPLETHFRVLRDPAFIPPTDEPIFFEEEFDVLKSKSIEQLRDVLKVKIAFPRSRVVQ